MEDKELKKLFRKSIEEPSYEFSDNTMRKIEWIESKKSALSIKTGHSFVVYTIPLVLLILVVISFFMNDPQLASFNFTLPTLEFSGLDFAKYSSAIHFSWIITSLALATGVWTWVWWEKNNLKVS